MADPLRQRSPHHVVIEPGRSGRDFWRDLFRYRELFFFFAWRDVVIRYKQTAIGVTWAVIRPLLTMLVFTFVFGTIARLPADGPPYAILVYAALLPWQFFSSALTESADSLVRNAGLVRKVWFPRIILPTSTIITAFVDLVISFALLLVLMLVLGYPPTWRFVTLPVFVVLAFLAALGPGLLITTLNVRYRDFRYAVPFLVSLGLYLSPVGFSSNVIPDRWRLLYSLNPMVSVIDGFRFAICAHEIDWPGFWLSFTVILLMLVCGIRVFRRSEGSFADVI